MTGPRVEPAVRVRISETLVARLAARRALTIPGVLAPPADLGRSLLSMAGARARLAPPDGASATVTDVAAEVHLVLVARLGHNCRDLAQAVQREVTAEVLGYTGLPVSVTVTIADVIPG